MSIFNYGTKPNYKFDSQFKKQRVASQPSSNFVFCVVDYLGPYSFPIYAINKGFEIKRIGGFQSIDGLGYSINKETFRSRSSRSSVELPKDVAFDDITIKKGFDNGNFIKKWANKAISGYAYMADIVILVLDGSTNNVFRVIGLRNAWVNKYSPGALNVDSNESWIEEVVLSHEEMAYLNFEETLNVVDLYDGKEYNYGKSEYFYADEPGVLDYGSFVGNFQVTTIREDGLLERGFSSMSIQDFFISFNF